MVLTVDHEMDTGTLVCLLPVKSLALCFTCTDTTWVFIVKGLFYKIIHEGDSDITYKHSNDNLQQSLSEVIAFKSDLEAEHRQALDVILCTSNDKKRWLENELQQSNESKRKLKELVTEMIEEKSSLET